MKIGIIGFCNLNIMQYLYKYTNILDFEGVNYDVIYWNRLGIEEKSNFNGNVIPYNHAMNTYQSFYKKIGMFFKYTVFMRKIIRENSYDKLIVLTTQTAIALFGLLCGRYKKKYIFDYRDITKEKKFNLYKKAVNHLIHDSFCTMMSSEGFIKEIGIQDKSRIQIAHNTRLAELSKYKVNLNMGIRRLNVVFWGIIRQLEHNKRVCDLFGNDERFRLVFHGTGVYEELKEYCNQKKYYNILFTGIYYQEDIPFFVKETDILHCIYANDDEQKPAMPVKAYDAIKYRIPILISRGSQAEIFFENAPGAFGVDIEKEGVVDEIYNWYRSLNAKDVEETYKVLEERVFNDDIDFEKKLKSFIH